MPIAKMRINNIDICTTSLYLITSVVVEQSSILLEQYLSGCFATSTLLEKLQDLFQYYSSRVVCPHYSKTTLLEQPLRSCERNQHILRTISDQFLFKFDHFLINFSFYTICQYILSFSSILLHDNINNAIIFQSKIFNLFS